ncbi:putative membrane-associated kinase regulator 1 [Cinnamomum micranthum f. kanehirae]|uniref:Putative membrane-associated kinase regulator 1 n=1 Tax=Cinnamomum micranthum f. kanehirae TaxID=337451 RepID=A0A443PXA5_9MAGN|nr:putative membrane-associated kinase regulator 1 [Cinnamomum micranthum f. kanehirae]
MEGDGRIHKPRSELQTSPSSPSSSSSSSSSSSFEFTTSLSPTKKTSYLCPADELFYKGLLLPLHLSPRISMVRTLLASSRSSSSSDTTTTASRDSTGSSNSFSGDDHLLLLAGLNSARPSSATEEEEHFQKSHQPKKSKYFSLSKKFSSVFLRKDSRIDSVCAAANGSGKRITATAREVFKKYVKKVKPLCEKLSPKHKTVVPSVTAGRALEQKNPRYPLSFSGNLRYPRRTNYISSCPTSMRSSPDHSGVRRIGSGSYSDPSSIEELQSAIQGAIAHCKNSMVSDFSQR